MSDFSTDFADYVCSGHSLLHIDTFEKDRVIADIIETAETIDRKVYVWSISQGWIDKDGKQVAKSTPEIPIENHLQEIFNFDENVICVLRDFGGYLYPETYSRYDVVISLLDDFKRVIASVGQTIVFVGPDFNIPKPLLHDITQVDFNLPDNKQIEERIKFACSDVGRRDGSKFELNKDIVPQIVDSCKGMTTKQVVDRVTLALRKEGDLNAIAIKTIVGEKASIIKASGLLTYIEPPGGGLACVGGYEAIKQHVRLDKPCFTEDARNFGIEFPRGLMLVGIPGCGKTLLSLAIASELSLPLIAMDVGNLMNKYVGESEGNLREAIRMLEKISPCVLQLDEIEKGFGGTGDMDGGASRRVFGTFIKWLNDRTSPVYVVATANQVQSLPPEFCRKGRFDEIYGLDLPKIGDRNEIFRIHLSKRNRDPDKYEVSKLATDTNGYTGADIEQVVKLSLKIAFAKGDSLQIEHIRMAIPEIIPLSVTERDRIEATRKWCVVHAKPANTPEKDISPKTKMRKVTLQPRRSR